MLESDIEHRFLYHPPTEEQTRKDHELARALGLALAVQLNALLPEGREKSLAITKLEECLFWCNAAIARQVK